MKIVNADMALDGGTYKVVIEDVVDYRDGGTMSVITPETTYCVDRRMGHLDTRGCLFLGYPKDDNSNLVPDEDFTIRRAIFEAAADYVETRYQSTYSLQDRLDFMKLS